MRTLRDSSNLAGDMRALRRELRRTGYLFLPGLLPTGAVDEVATDLIRVLRQAGWVRDNDASAVRGWRGNTRHRRIPPSVYAELQACERLHQLVCHEITRNVVKALLGPAVVHPQRLIRVVLPVNAGGPQSSAVHRDYPSWRVPDMITTWCPVLPCPPERGGLCVLEGSHLVGVEHPDDLSDDAWATAFYRPGDLLLLHCYTVHGTLPNTSCQVRLSVDSRWQRLSDPIPSWACRPDGAADWKTYTRSWSSTDWIAIPGEAVVTEDEDEWEPLSGLPPSSLLAPTWTPR